MDWVRVTNATSDQVPTTARTYPIEFRRMSSRGLLWAEKLQKDMQTVRRTGAHGPRGPIQAPIIIGKLPLFIRWFLKNNGFLKIMVHYKKTLICGL